MISAFFFLNLKGEIVISRHYRDDIKPGTYETFRQQIVVSKASSTPVIVIDKTSFLSVIPFPF